MTIKELVEISHGNAVKKGFHKKSMEVGTMLALVHSELSEALEAHRTGKTLDIVDGEILEHFIGDPIEEVSSTGGLDWFANGAKETFEMELADTVIRVADICGQLGIDLQRCIQAKMRYNASRPYLHGKRY